jgi:CubicO group peptidase (beta-lactamase class C family)
MFGKAEIHADTPIAPDTLFWVRSMAKAFTAPVWMQLIKQGRLHLD